MLTEAGAKKRAGVWLLTPEEAAQEQIVRRPTKPTYGSKQRRLQSKAIRSQGFSCR